METTSAKLSLVIQNHYFKYQLEERVSLEDVEKFNEQSSEIIEYMSNTVDDFRNFFSPEKEIKEFSLSKSLQKVITLNASQTKEYNIIIYINEKCESKAYGYPNEFSQVILNLISNAKDAFVTQKIKNREINISLYEDKKHITVEFLDNAGGISYEILPRIFDPYFTTKSAKNGSGIGLYMSKMIIEKSMNGEFKVENRAKGTLFSIVLPKVL